eukprot:2753771-Rhodomonas_salina.1
MLQQFICIALPVPTKELYWNSRTPLYCHIRRFDLQRRVAIGRYEKIHVKLVRGTTELVAQGPFWGALGPVLPLLASTTTTSQDQGRNFLAGPHLRTSEFSSAAHFKTARTTTFRGIVLVEELGSNIDTTKDTFQYQSCF